MADAPSRRARTAARAILGASLVCIGIITLSPTTGFARLPFWCLRCGTRPGVDVLLNILLFVPVGVGLGLLRLRATRMLLLIVGGTLAVEALQFLVVPGRFASFRDIVANTAGGVAGWWIARSWRALAVPSEGTRFAHVVVIASMWLGVQSITAWSLAVDAPPGPWWAQIKRHGHEFPEVFGGDVVQSSIGTVPIRYSDRIEQSDHARRQLIQGAAVTTVVTGARPSAGPAPILTIATPDALAEVAALVQDGQDAFFRIRTRAAVLGLRNPSLRLANAFTPGSAGDTVALSASYSDGRYRIASERRGMHQQRELASSPSWAWALVVPIPHYSFGREARFVTAAWLFVAIGLIGFLAGQRRDHSAARPRRPHARDALPVIAVLVAGLSVVPVAFALPVSHWSEWLAAAAGCAVGQLLGRRRSATLPPVTSLPTV